MKLTLLVGAVAAIPIAIAAPALAENPAHVQQLLETNLCQGCDLSGANLTQAHLIGADLRDANLQGANLVEANLEGADLSHADLTGANLTRAFLTNALLQNATLDWANLTEATLYFVDVTGASLLNADLTGADIVGSPIRVGGDELGHFQQQKYQQTLLPHKGRKPCAPTGGYLHFPEISLPPTPDS